MDTWPMNANFGLVSPKQQARFISLCAKYIDVGIGGFCSLPLMLVSWLHRLLLIFPALSKTLARLKKLPERLA